MSFDRPYDVSTQGAGRFFLTYPSNYGDPNLQLTPWPEFGFEYAMVRFLEKNGYDVTYATDIDLHGDNSHTLLNSRAAFLSVGHDEYWSKNMHDNLKWLRDNAKNIAFFSGNSLYWIINLLSSDYDPNRLNRVIYTDKNAVAQDVQGSYSPWRWENCARSGGGGIITPPRCNDTDEQSEQTLVGSLSVDGKYDRGDVVFSTADFQAPSASWFFAGTGLQPGDRLPGLIGYEAQFVCGVVSQYCDASRVRQTPPNQTIIADSSCKAHLANSPQYPNLEYLYADMSLYQNGGLVFSSGGPDWSFGLDIYTTDFPQTIYAVVHPAIAQITRNVLAKLAGVPSVAPFPTPVGYSLSVTTPGPYHPGSTITVHWTAPQFRPLCQQQICTTGDFITLYPEGVSDDGLGNSYPACYTRGATSGNCDVVVPNNATGTWAANYVALNRLWTNDYGETNFRTIWRGAKTATFNVVP